MSYTYGATKPKPKRTPPINKTVEQIRQEVQQIRAETQNIRAATKETHQLTNAKIQWHAAKTVLDIAKRNATTLQQRMDEAEIVRQNAIKKYRYTASGCDARLTAAAHEASQWTDPRSRHP